MKIATSGSSARTAAEKIGIEAIDRRHSVLNVKFHEKTRVDGEKLMSLVSGTPGAQFTPAAILELIEQKLIALLS